MKLLKQRATILRRHWEDMARSDALWAVLTDPAKKGGGWNEAAFYETGRETIAAHVALLPAEEGAGGPGSQTDGPKKRRGRALDFGCGVGRLTWALADHFQHVVGVDISASMLGKARAHRAETGNVDFVLNTTPDLRAWADGSFDFVYSHLVLQHNPVPLIETFIGELCRVCRPGGYVMFQLPARTLHRRARKPWWMWFWPPSLVKRTWRAFNRVAVVRGVMEVNFLEADRVRQLLTEAGMIDVRAYDDLSAGPGYPGFLYLARKD